jgi:hypothetical protein
MIKPVNLEGEMIWRFSRLHTGNRSISNCWVDSKTINFIFSIYANRKATYTKPENVNIKDTIREFLATLMKSLTQNKNSTMCNCVYIEAY